MDEAQPLLRIARQRRQLPGVFQPQLARRTVADRTETGWLRRKSYGCRTAQIRLLVDVLMRGGDEAFEQRMRLVRLAQEFRMELAGQEERMARQFDDFHQLAVRGQCR